MPTLAETAANFDALEAQAQRLMSAFTAAGCELVAPAIIQPASLMLDVVGEDLRARTYVFSDADGAELCLRPDLTVPTCRLYLERHADAAVEARYCYNGPAFRYRPLDAPKGNPREFRQAGVESFGATRTAVADAEIVAITHDAVAAASAASRGRLCLRMGDLSILADLLDAIRMPERWRRRLRNLYWRPDAFRAELRRLVSAQDEAARRLPPGLVEALDPADRAAAEAVVAAYLDRAAHELQGTRSLAEITDGVLAAVADARTRPLAADDAHLIESYIATSAPVAMAVDRIAAATRRPGLDLTPALIRFEERLKLIAKAGVPLAEAEFSGDFGRKFEYYTGFVFELEAQGHPHGNPIAGGGRYDGLLEIIGAPRPVPAVGAAIYTERVLALGGDAA